MALAREEIKRLVSMLQSQSLENRALLLKTLPIDDALRILREFSEEEQTEILDLLPPDLTRELREALVEKVEIPPELIDEILRGNCVLFLGAGVSFEAGMPSSQQLVRALGYDPNMVPLTVAAQRFEDERGRTELCNIVKQEFDIATRFMKLESLPFIVNIPKLSALVVTTNYDTLLEEAFRREEKTPLTIRRETELPLATGKPNVIVKLHGDIDQSDTMVITQGDYARVTAGLREPGGFGSLLASLLATRTVIFVGFSMADEDFGLIRDFVAARMIDVSGRRTLRTQYAVMPWEEAEAKVLETQLNIKVIRGKAGDFFAAVFRRTSEFLNREEELREICEVRKEPLVEIVGHAGSGKTMLLKGIETFYRIQQGFNPIVSIPLEENEAPEMLLWRLAERYNLDIGTEEEGERQEEILERRVARLVTGVRGTSVLFAFDGTERAPKLVRWLEQELLPRLRRMWAEGLGTGRVVFAGRQPFPWQPTTRLHLYSLTLTPFLRDAVEDMVKKYYILFRRETSTVLERRRIAEAILQLTGTGHAGFIKAVLDEVTQQPKEQYPSAADLVHYIEEHAGELIEQKLVPLLEEEILKGAEEYILQALEKLVLVPSLEKEILKETAKHTLQALEKVICIFRRLNSSVLKSLPGKGLAQYGVEETVFVRSDPLLDILESLHLLSAPDAKSPMYRLDPVAAFLLSLWLRRRERELYCKAHEIALGICDEGVQRTTNHFQLAYALEGFYHLQCLREIGASQEKLADKARQYLGQLQSKEDTKALFFQLKEMVLEDPDLRWKVEEETRKLTQKAEEREGLAAEVYGALTAAFDRYLIL